MLRYTDPMAWFIGRAEFARSDSADLLAHLRAARQAMLVVGPDQAALTSMLAQSGGAS